MLTDLYQIPVHTMQSDEGAALGAAILAGVAAGVYRTVAEGCEIAARANAPLLPDPEAHRAYMPYYTLYQSLYPTLKDSFKALREI
jgi:xylulokinase